jgi:hypothetical protein
MLKGIVINRLSMNEASLMYIIDIGTAFVEAEEKTPKMIDEPVS